MFHIFRQLDALLYPPIINILLLLVALLLWRRRKTALMLVSVSMVTLLFFSLPAVSRQLLAGLEAYPAIPPKALSHQQAQAIVVIGGGVDPHAEEYGGPNLTESSYERLRYAAFIQRSTGLPVLASGGYHLSESYGEADIMKQILVSDFSAREVWVENTSSTTRENAAYSARVLRDKGLQRIFLVTHALHMQRAVELFLEQGLEVIPAPTSMTPNDPLQWIDFMPGGKAMAETRWALHEYLGRLLYFL